MPIKKRTLIKPARQPLATKNTYQQYRTQCWAIQGGAEPWNFRTGKNKNGGNLLHTILNPRQNLFFKDVWISPNAEHARECILTVLEFPQVTYAQWENQFVWISFREDDENWELEGQATDDRSKVTG